MKTLVTMATCHGFFNDDVNENPPILPEKLKKTECQFRYAGYFVNFIGFDWGWMLNQSKFAGVHTPVFH
jgi:hypothetical protein